MKEKPSRNRWSTELALVIGLATLLRLAAALYLGDGVEALPGVHDQLSYDRLAQRVAGGHSFSFDVDWWPATRAQEPTAHWSYLYTLFLAAIYRVAGHAPLLARILQALISGLLHPWLSWRIGRRLFGPSAGLAAAGIAGAYAYFVYYSAALMSEIFYILAILWALDIATRMISARKVQGQEDSTTSTTGSWLLLGVALGTGALLRQVVLLFVPFLLGWVWWVRRPRSREIPGLLVAVSVIVLTIAPWTIRNYSAFHQFVLLNTNAGFAFFWGNHPVHGTSFIPILSAENPSYQELIPEELRGLNEAALDRALMSRGVRFVMEDPERYLLLSLSRTREYFKFWPSSQSEPLSNLGRVGSFGLFLPLMLIGLIASLRRRARTADALQPVSEIGQAMPLYLFIVVYSGIHLASWTLIRYRLPVDAVLVVFAGLGVVVALNWLRKSSRFHRPDVER